MIPRPREDRLVVRDLPEETLVYDLENHRAHCLSPMAARVWRLCHRNRTAREIAAVLRADGFVSADEDAVWLALERLRKARLLLDPVVRTGKAPNLARRRMLMQSLRAASLAPFVTSILAPSPAQAASVSCTEAKCESNNSANCSGCLNAPCSDEPGERCTRVRNVCACR